MINDQCPLNIFLHQQFLKSISLICIKFWKFKALESKLDLLLMLTPSSSRKLTKFKVLIFFVCVFFSSIPDYTGQDYDRIPEAQSLSR